MRLWNRFLTTVLVLCAMCIPCLESKAAEPYTYTVTFYSGVQGDFEGGKDALVQDEIEAGATLYFTAQSAVSLEEGSKYYVKGVRLAGKDNSEAETSQLTVQVNKDADYVVVYGIKGNQVSYTVNYEDVNGNKLADSDVFYGNVGDKPVVAYKYIEGYVPQVYAFTKTLSENEAENVFTFVYEKAEIVTGGGGGTTIVYKDKVTTIVTGGGTSGAGAGTGTGGAGQEQPEQPSSPEPAPGPQEIVDLDDEETPLGDIDLEDPEVQNKISVATIVSLVGISLVALIILVILGLRFKDHLKNN